MKTGEILDFLSDLTENNNREWMDANRMRYLEVKKAFEDLVGNMIRSISAFEPEISGLTPKECVFRIHRDVRFAADKSPYKTNFGASINKGGKKSQYPTYYLHLQPGGSFLAGGIYMPPGDLLRRLRQEIDYNSAAFAKILAESSFQEYFGGLAGDKLKRAPQGYDPSADHIEWLKYKSYIVSHDLGDSMARSSAFEAHAVRVFEAMLPFNRFLGAVFEDMEQ